MCFARRDDRGIDVADDRSDLAEPLDLGQRFGVTLDAGDLVGGGFTVEVRAREGGEVVGHVGSFGRSESVSLFPSSGIGGRSSSRSRFASIARPRAIRDFTVPTGMSSTDAISA